MRQISSAGDRDGLLPAGGEKGYVYTSPLEEGHIRDYWAILVKRCRLLILSFSIFFGVGAYFTFSSSPLYIAIATIKIDPQNPTVTGLAELLPAQAGVAGPYDYYQTQFALLGNRALAARVIRDLKLESNPDFINARVKSANPVARIRSYVSDVLRPFFPAGEVPSKQRETTSEITKDALRDDREVLNSPDSRTTLGLVERYRSFLRVQPVRNTHLVEVEFTTPDPELSQQLANAHAEDFIRMNLETRSDMTMQARQFLDSKNVELKKELEKSEAALNQFRQTHGVVSLDKGENVVVDRLVEINKALTAAKAQRIDAESLFRAVQDKDSQSLSQVMNQGLVPTLRTNLATLDAERIKLSVTLKSDHPRMLELNQQISETRRSINNEIANVVRGIQGNYAAALGKEKALQAEADRQQQKALNLKQVGVEYAVLEEEVKVNRGLYESILKRLNETHVVNDLTLSNMRIVERAYKPVSPSYPRTARSLIIYAVLGLLLCAGLVVGLEYFDSSVNTPQHVWRAVGLSTFGAVPAFNSLHQYQLRSNGSGRPLLNVLTRFRLPAPNAGSSELVVTHNPLSFIAESYRTIRTAFLFSQAEKPPQVVLLTSPSPSDGKTITTLNLGITLAQDGHRVLIVDADLRKGCCHTRLKLQNHKGLSNVLTGILKLDQAIQATQVDGLFLMSTGIRPPNPVELLGSQKMREVLNKLRESFQFVLIDSPPAIPVSDAAVLSMVCDGVILVFHGRKTTLNWARKAVERLHAIRAPILGVVLNGVDPADPEYAYYRHDYGSDHSDPETSEAKHGDTTATETSSTDISKREISTEKIGLETVPRAFFDDMAFNLSDALGPIAPLLLTEKVRLLGESLEAFPWNRLTELFERLDEEIVNERLWEQFQRRMQEQLKSFTHTI